PAGDEDAVDRLRYERPIRHRDAGKFGREGGRNTDLVVPYPAGAPVGADHSAFADNAAAVADADLWSAKHQECVFKSRCVFSVNVEMADRELARPDFNRGQVLDIDGAVAGKPWPHE